VHQQTCLDFTFSYRLDFASATNFDARQQLFMNNFFQKIPNFEPQERAARARLRFLEDHSKSRK
jgi:hypothetical protein